MNITDKKRLRGNILLLIAAFIWGTAFVAQKEGVDVLHPCTYNGIRSFVGAIALIPVILITDAGKKKNGTYCKDNIMLLLLGGFVCGFILFVASTLQTTALIDEDPGKAGFMTALYLIIVPFLGVFVGKKVRRIVWLCALLATVGLYFLCVKEGTSFSFNKPEILLLLGALSFAFHIMSVDYFSPKLNGIKLSCLQFTTVGIISLFYIVIVDKPAVADIIRCAVPILYAGVMSSGIAYTLQIVAQKDTDPAVASIIMSMESLFALLAGMVFLGEMPGTREFIGCAFMMAAILLVEMPEKRRKN